MFKIKMSVQLPSEPYAAMELDHVAGAVEEGFRAKTLSHGGRFTQFLLSRHQPRKPHNTQQT